MALLLSNTDKHLEAESKHFFRHESEMLQGWAKEGKKKKEFCRREIVVSTTDVCCFYSNFEHLPEKKEQKSKQKINSSHAELKIRTI